MIRKQYSTELLKSLSEQLKPLNSPKDLVQIGLAGTVKSLANQRCEGTGPDYVRIKGTGVRYPKEAVLAWFSKSAR